MNCKALECNHSGTQTRRGLSYALPVMRSQHPARCSAEAS